jgi:multifunctional methyltransferase subunit TRM112
MVKSILAKVNWEALKGAAVNIGNSDIADVTAITEEVLENETVLRRIHHLLFEVSVVDGNLVCPESGRKFPIKDGIPNMLLIEDEV